MAQRLYRHSQLLRLGPLVTLSGFLLAGGCANQDVREPSRPLPNADSLPEPNLTVRIESLSNCTDETDDMLRLNTKLPVIVIVHGCYASSGQFRTLADVFALHGQQAICFNYDDRASLEVSSAQLIDALRALSGLLDEPRINLIGHSQGGLVARRAMISDRPDALDIERLRVDLTTISAPFAGIDAASHCGSKAFTWLSLGLIRPVCRMITGMKYREIPPSSQFINEPGTLLESVSMHLQIITDESGSCRVYDEDGDCRESDFVFRIDEQRKEAVSADERVRTVVVDAGHVAIIGDDDRPPLDLISLLQREGIMQPAPDASQIAFSRLIRDLYGAAH